MKRTTYLIVILLGILLSPSLHIKELNAMDTNNSENPVETYALLFDQFPYEVNGTIMCSAAEFKESLLTLGWHEENISMFLGEENITKIIILEQLNYLESVVDENDLVFIYIMAHGHTYCRDVLEFNSWFQFEFFQINTKNKIFLMDSCYAGEFVKNFYGSCYAMSSVGESEVAIGYFPEENGTWILSEPPFVGGISSHFWVKSLASTEADASLDNVISLNEMYIHSLQNIRDCYNETFELYPSITDYIENIAGYTENYPYPKILNNLQYEITINATDYILNNEKYVWEGDVKAPKIECQGVVYFTKADNYIDLIFQISDQSDFEYFCYVNEILEKWGNHHATGDDSWNYTYRLKVQPNSSYNVSLAAIDGWSNRNVNFTLVLYIEESDSANYSFMFSMFAFLIFQITILCLKARKRKD